jgi:hypothetical protein
MGPDMRRPPRMAVLLVILTAVAAWVMRDEAMDVSASHGQSVSPTPAAPTTPAPLSLRAELPARVPAPDAAGNPFVARSWLPPPAPVRAAPVVAPEAPLLPYRFAGEFQLPNETQIFLGRGDNAFRVKPGDTLDGEYRVEAIRPGELVLLHLASGTRQIMRFGLPAEGDQVRLRTVAAPATGMQPLVPAPTKAFASDDADEDSVAASASRPATIRWEGPSEVQLGKRFDVSLRMTAADQVRSAPMQLRFDPAVLKSLSVKPGRYFSDRAGNFGYRVNGDGSIHVGMSNHAPGTAADAEILVMTFQVIKPDAAAELSVAVLNLEGAAGAAIAHADLTPFRTTITH